MSDPWTDPDIATNNRAAETGQGSKGIIWSDLFPTTEPWTPTYPDTVVGD